MNRIYLLPLVVILFFSLNSCHPLTRLIYGVRQPKLVKASTVSKYMKKLDMDNEIILTPRDINSYLKILKIVDGIPNLLVFNQQGIALKDTGTNSCNAPLFDQTQNVCSLQILLNRSVGKLDEFLAMLKPLTQEDSLRFEEARRKDINFTAFVSSARYAGYLNKDHVKPWVDNLSAINECKLNTYIINMDLLDGVWTEEMINKIKYK